MSTHPLVEVVERYFKGCNTGDVDLMMSCFTDDVHAYFVDPFPDVVGGKNLAHFWRELHNATGARWTVDHAIVQGNEAVVEWTELFTPAHKTSEDLWRGTDWFIFDDGLISEIRQYHPVHDLQPGQSSELMGFSYSDRGYPTRNTFDSKLP